MDSVLSHVNPASVLIDFVDDAWLTDKLPDEELVIPENLLAETHGQEHEDIDGHENTFLDQTYSTSPTKDRWNELDLRAFIDEDMQ